MNQIVTKDIINKFRLGHASTNNFTNHKELKENISYPIITVKIVKLFMTKRNELLSGVKCLKKGNRSMFYFHHETCCHQRSPRTTNK